MYKILIVEDDKALSNGVSLALKNTDTEIFQAYSISAAKQSLADKNVDLIILDVNLPDGNGLDLLQEIKHTTRISVIILTANDMELDIVTGLEMGADDYITKPFSLSILRARVNTQLRKNHQSKENLFIQDEFHFNFDKMEFLKHNTAIELSKTEQKLLRLLVKNKGITLERAALVDRIWTDGAEYVDENALSVTIKRLRDKLEDNASKPQYIKTIYGVGYMWEAE